jgi:hypothetical protein
MSVTVLLLFFWKQYSIKAKGHNIIQLSMDGAGNKSYTIIFRDYTMVILITLFKSITLFICGKNILQNNNNPTEHYYGFKLCYARLHDKHNIIQIHNNDMWIDNIS